MRRTDYYLETISEFLNSIKKPDLLTQEEVEQLAEDIAISRENESTFYGHDCIPHPDNSEIKKLEQRVKDMEKEADRRDTHWQEAVGYALKIPSKDVVLDTSRGVIRRRLT